MAEVRDRREPIARQADPVLRVAENGLYALAGLLLALGAFAVLVAVGYRLATDLSEGTVDAVSAALDGLLLMFILLELLAAVRVTMTEGKLVAEPFLVVGIIASIKEIVVTVLEARDLLGQDDDAFEQAMIEVGVLGGVVLLLAVAVLLVRRKEREPEE